MAFGYEHQYMEWRTYKTIEANPVLRWIYLSANATRN